MSAGLEHYRRLFGERAQQPMTRRGSLDRASLPSPRSYLRQHGMLDGKPRGEWAQIRCPSHKGGDERNPSMSVSLVDGHFACHACGAKGGDIVALHRLATGLAFHEAVRELGGQFHE
jgi:hypothetical protein